jgi:hypothetical protein
MDRPHLHFSWASRLEEWVILHFMVVQRLGSKACWAVFQSICDLPMGCWLERSHGRLDPTTGAHRLLRSSRSTMEKESMNIGSLFLLCCMFLDVSTSWKLFGGDDHDECEVWRIFFPSGWLMGNEPTVFSPAPNIMSDGFDSGVLSRVSWWYFSASWLFQIM